MSVFYCRIKNNNTNNNIIFFFLPSLSSEGRWYHTSDWLLLSSSATGLLVLQRIKGWAMLKLYETSQHVET